MSGLGLWPHGNKNIRRFKNFVIILIFSVFLIVQFVSMIRRQYTVSGYIKSISPFAISLAYLFKYLTFLSNTGLGLKIFRDVSYDWDTVENDEEFRIMTKYAYSGYRFGKIFACKE
ncbi:uncharacterized protein LOC113465005 [Ceratina calcarata]|uniref:Uncharacterized protein LOC113465005 n=1 Tax=Ceratina calcarata TaxID=156304 RepID=A0AAJ7S9D1_9HYME|nr:uncharacterized protein LOC113465005 [Ceratina calcarata]